MQILEIVSIVATFLGVTSFSVVFTILYQSYVRSTVTQVESGKRDIELIDTALNEKSEKTKRKRKIGNFIKTALFVLFLMIVIPVFALSLINRFAGDKPVLGKTFMVVASGSMSVKHEDNEYLVTNNLNNQFARYDIIILEKVSDPASLKKYDVIAYRNDEGTNIIHRIIEISGSGENIRFTTRGDANNATDEYKPTFADVIGVYRTTHVPAVGIVVLFLQSWSGIITVVALLYCLFMIDHVSRKIEKCEDKRLGQLMGAIESDEFTAKSMRAEFKETIFYRGYAYRFDETGFLGKNEVTESESPPEDVEEDVMLKVYDDGTPSQKITIETLKVTDDGTPSEKTTIETRKNDENGNDGNAGKEA